MLEVLYARKFPLRILFSQPVRMIVFESMLYDNELEKELIDRQSAKAKAESSGRELILGSRDVIEQLFEMKFPEDAAAIVTLLSTEEYMQLARKSKNNDTELPCKNSRKRCKDSS